MFQFDQNEVIDINSYNLPDLLTTFNGKTIKTKSEWKKRRKEILERFSEVVYGEPPKTNYQLEFELEDLDEHALNDSAIRKQIKIMIKREEKSIQLNLLLYLPKKALKKPVATFLALNFSGNHTTHIDKKIKLPQEYTRKLHSPPEDYRGVKTSNYPIELMLKAGFGFATMFAGDIDPDHDDGFRNGIHGLLDNERNNSSWGTIAAWSWGLSRIMDYLQADKHVNAKKVVVVGHSRMGKAALWAGAQDERFAIAISNNSGCTGASLARHKSGETVYKINKRFPHWFCNHYKLYNRRQKSLPVDQHMLLALMAPRPVYVASATRDDWADQVGEFLSCIGAKPAYDLYNLKSLDGTKIPITNIPLNNSYVGYHIRTGEHTLTEFDWECFIEFSKKHLMKKIK